MRHKVLIAAKLLLAVGLLVFVFWKVVDVRQIAQALSERMQWRYFALAAVLQWTAVVICTHRLMILLRAQDVHLTFRYTLKCTFIGFFFNLFSLGSTGGDVVKAFYIARETDHRKTESVTVVFLDRLVGMAAVLLIAACSLLATLWITDAFRFLIPFVLLAILAGVLAAGLIFTKNYWQRYAWWRRLSHYVPQWAGRVVNAVHAYRAHKWIGITALIESIVVQLTMCIIAWCLGAGLGFDKPMYIYFIVFPLGALILALPVSPSGLGTGELAFIEGFKRFGVDGGPAAAFVVLLRLLMLSMSLVGFVLWMLPGSHVKRSELVAGVEELDGEGR